MTPARLFGIYGLTLVAFAGAAGLISRLGPRARFLVARATVLSMLFVAACGVVFWLDCTVATAFFLTLAAAVSSFALSKEMASELVNAFGRWRFPVYLAAFLTVSALVHIHLPIATYLSSPDEFTLGIGKLMADGARNLMTSFYLAVVGYGLAASPRMKGTLTFLALLGLGLGFIYGLVYPFGYPPMNGFLFEQIPIDRATLERRGVIDLVTVGGMAAAVATAWKRLGARRLLLGVALLNLALSASSALRLLQNDDDSPTRAEPPAISERPLRFAMGQDNVLIVFLDRFMGGFIEPILEQAPDLAMRLDGFTWYPRTVSAGENTIAGFHPLLGGYDYTPRELAKRHAPLRETSAESYAILPYNFTQKGWGSNLVNPRGLGFTFDGNCRFIPIAGSCTHVSSAVDARMAQQFGLPLPKLPNAGSAELLSFLGAMRVAPYGLREIINLRVPRTIAVDHVAGITFRQWAELKALPTLTRTDADRSQLNVLVNILTHEPYFLDTSCTPRPSMPKIAPADVGMRADRSTYTVQHFLAAKCSLLLLADYFEWMKEIGIYDSTKIVVVSDHGINGPVEDRSSRAVAGGTTANDYVRSRSLLLIKDRNAHGAIRTSEKFLPNAEVPRIVCEDIGGCVNPFLGDRTIEAHGRDMPFVVTAVPFQYARQKAAFDVLWELELDAPDPYRASNWRQVR